MWATIGTPIHFATWASLLPWCGEALVILSVVTLGFGAERRIAAAAVSASTAKDIKHSGEVFGRPPER